MALQIQKILSIIVCIINIASLTSTEQNNEINQNEEVVGIIPPGLMEAKIRNDLIRNHLHTLARANMISHHVPQMRLVPVFRDAEGINSMETNTVDEESMQSNNDMLVKTNENAQMLRAITNGDPAQMSHAITNEDLQMLREVTNEDPQMSHLFTNEGLQMLRAATNENPQMSHSITNEDLQMLRAVTNEDPHMFHVVTNDDPEMFRTVTNDDSHMFRAINDDDYFDLNDNEAEFMENLPEDFLNFQMINDENEFRSSPMMLVNMPSSLSNEQNLKFIPMANVRVVQKPVFQDASVKKINTTPEKEQIDKTIPDGIVRPPTGPNKGKFEFVDSVPKPTPSPDNRSSAVNDPNVSLNHRQSETESQNKTSNRPTLSITGTIADLHKALINQTKPSTTDSAPENLVLNRPVISLTGQLSDLRPNFTRPVNTTSIKVEDTPINARMSSNDLQDTNFKPTAMYCLTLSDKNLPQINSQRVAPPEDINPNMDSNNASNHILPAEMRSQTFIADADVVIPLNNNHIDEEPLNIKHFAPIQHTITPIRIVPSPVQTDVHIQHIPHVTPVHVISHENNYGNQNYFRNSEARSPHIIKNNFISTEFVSPSTHFNQFPPQFHRPHVIPSTQTFSEATASSSTFQNNGGFHRVFIPSGGSSSSFAQASSSSQQPIFNRFRSNDNDFISNTASIEENDQRSSAGFGVQPTIKKFRFDESDSNPSDNIVAIPYLFQAPPVHHIKRRSVSENLTSNSLIPIIKGIESVLGDSNTTNKIMEPLKNIEQFLEKHTINEHIKFEKNEKGEPIIKTEFSTNFNPQELFNEFEELPKENHRTKRTLALIHLLTRQPPMHNNDLLARQAQNDNLPPILHLRNALGSAGRAAINVVETPLLGYIFPRNFGEESIGETNPNNDFHQRLADNQHKTIEHYHNTLEHLGNAIHAQRQRYSARQDNSPDINQADVASVQDPQIITRSVEPVQETPEIPIPRQPQMIIRPIGRAWTRMGNPTRRFYFVAEPVQSDQIMNQSDLISTVPRTVDVQETNVPKPIRKLGKKYKKVLNRQPTKFEPSREDVSNKNPNTEQNSEMVVGVEINRKNNEQSTSQQGITNTGENVPRNSMGILGASNLEVDTKNTDVSSNETEKKDILSANNPENLITINQCKEMQQNGEIKVKREENISTMASTENVGTIQFTSFMKKPFGGLATQEQIDNFLSDSTNSNN